MARWFRFYSEVVNDPKVQKLPCEDFRAWVNMLCLASENDGRLPSIHDMAFALRMSEDAVLTVVERLSSGGLIDRLCGGVDGYHYAPHSWDKRQYKSDTSTDRVKRFRERSNNVSETPPETEADTEQKHKDKTTSYLSSEFDDFWKQYPRKVGKGAALKAYAKARKENDHATLIGAIAAQRTWGIWTEDRFIPHASTWLNEQRWSDERPKQTSGAKPTANGSQPKSMAEIVLERQAARGRENDLPDDGWIQTGSDGVFVSGPDEREPRPSPRSRSFGYDPARG